MLTEYAQYEDGVFLEYHKLKKPPVDAPQKGYTWLPVVRETADNSTGSETVTTVAAPVDEATRRLITTTIRDKTPQEIDDDLDAELEAELDDDDRVNSMGRANRKISRDHENRLRALEGNVEPQLTPPQWRAYRKARMN